MISCWFACVFHGYPENCCQIFKMPSFKNGISVDNKLKSNGQRNQDPRLLSLFFFQIKVAVGSRYLHAAEIKKRCEAVRGLRWW